jgi:predicted metal-dependent TIM-barrel fold hydrolase
LVSIFDHHVHMDTRSCSDYEAMALAGVTKMLVPTSPTLERKFCVQSYCEHFDRLARFEPMRAAAFGVQLVVALSVNAGDLGDCKAALAAIGEVEKRLAQDKVVAVGELSIRTFSDVEIELFRRQLELGTRCNCPVIVEAPIDLPDVERLVAVLDQAFNDGLAHPERVCMIDVNHEKLQLARKLRLGAYGVAVSPKVDGLFCLREKCDFREVLRMVEDFGTDGLMLNSGLHVGFADPLCLPKTVLRLRVNGLDEKTLHSLAGGNAQEFFQRYAA